jgi:oxygen-independent coproporphyrinogen-3 oxidase
VSSKLPPLSLYLHLPWCARKCPYCDFNSHATSGKPPRDRYVAALRNDLENEATLAAGRPLQSIFIGGGTPSLFAPQEIEAILSSVKSLFVVSGNCEVTLEANPGTLERGNLAGYRQAGVNRLSLGAQSFNSDMLRVLGRIHGPAEILTAFDEAQAAGFASINIDLMFALPGQTLEMALEDVNQVCNLQPQHVSYYQLTLEPNTIFFERPPPAMPDDDLSWEIQERGHERLAEAGYEQYEISAFAQPGHRCRHNLNYWTFGDYLAAGAGAHGKITAMDGSISRYSKPAHPFAYMERHPVDAQRPVMQALQEKELGFEYMLNALRLPGGFSATGFAERTGLPLALLEAPLTSAKADGLLQETAAGVWRPTPLGLRFLNDLQSRFLPEDSAQ